MTVELRTGRATIRPWREDEAARLHDIRGRIEVARWLGNGDEALSPGIQDARESIARSREAATVAVPGLLAIAPADGNPPVGSVLVSALGDGDEVEIGWHLHPDATGHGWATEAATAMLAHALAHHDRVFAIMWPANASSAAVAARIGMHDLGQVLDPWYGSVPHPHSHMFVAVAASGAGAERAVADARATIAARVADHVFPEAPDPSPEVVLEGWRETAAHLLAAPGRG